MNNHKRELRRNVVESLALAMQDRGTDSTGVACLFDDNSAKLLKDTEKAAKFIEEDKFDKIIESNPACLIGHTRFATVGEVSRRNAHPFRKGNIVGAHNGGVENYIEINKGVQVDSEVIFALLKKHRNDYKKAFKRLSGDFAIVWTNLEERHSLYLVRDGNPLYFAIVPTLKTIFWCSTETPLNIILRATLGKHNFELFEVDEEKVYCFDEFLQHKKFKVAFKEKVRATHYGSAYYHNDYDWGGRLKGWQKKKKWSKRKGQIALLEHPGEEGVIKEEEIDPSDEDGYDDIGFSKDGTIFIGDAAAQDLQRRGYEDGCSICSTQLIGDMWIDVYAEELYCDQCAADILEVEGGKETYHLEKVSFELPTEEEAKELMLEEGERRKTYYG